MCIPAGKAVHLPQERCCLQHALERPSPNSPAREKRTCRKVDAKAEKVLIGVRKATPITLVFRGTDLFAFSESAK
jgi:hypothetical protein